MQKKDTRITENGNYKVWTILNTGNTACKCEKCGHKVSNKDSAISRSEMEKHLVDCK